MMILHFLCCVSTNLHKNFLQLIQIPDIFFLSQKKNIQRDENLGYYYSQIRILYFRFLSLKNPFFFLIHFFIRNDTAFVLYFHFHKKFVCIWRHLLFMRSPILLRSYMCHHYVSVQPPPKYCQSFWLLLVFE